MFEYAAAILCSQHAGEGKSCPFIVTGAFRRSKVFNGWIQLSRETDMLVLSRRIEQTVCIGPTIRVKVLKVWGHHVKIGIEAPHDVSIWREERAPECHPSRKRV